MGYYFILAVLCEVARLSMRQSSHQTSAALLTRRLQLLLAVGGRQRLHRRAAKLASLGLGADVAAPYNGVGRESLDVAVAAAAAG